MIDLEVENKSLSIFCCITQFMKNIWNGFLLRQRNGPLTSRLQNIKVGDEIITNTKAVGTLVLDNLKSGRNLYMLATGTGVALYSKRYRNI